MVSLAFIIQTHSSTEHWSSTACIQAYWVYVLAKDARFAVKAVSKAITYMRNPECQWLENG